MPGISQPRPVLGISSQSRLRPEASSEHLSAGKTLILGQPRASDSWPHRQPDFDPRSDPSLIHPEIKSKRAHSWYKLYGNCGFSYWISGCIQLAAHLDERSLLCEALCVRLAVRLCRLVPSDPTSGPDAAKSPKVSGLVADAKYLEGRTMCYGS